MADKAEIHEPTGTLTQNVQPCATFECAAMKGGFPCRFGPGRGEAAESSDSTGPFGEKQRAGALCCRNEIRKVVVPEAGDPYEQEDRLLTGGQSRWVCAHGFVRGDA